MGLYRLVAVASVLVVTGCGTRGTSQCQCDAGDPVCGLDGHTYASACAAGCAGVAVAHAGACVSDGGQADGGGRQPCTSDADCFADYGACGCGAICSNRFDPPSPQPDGGCMLGCAGAPLPWNCVCSDGVCTAGTRQLGSSCDPAADDCQAGSSCCATCCGVPTPDGGVYDPAYECVAVSYGTTGPYCPPVP